MEKAKISVIQLFSLMFMFNMGTSVVVSYGVEAKKDAWLAILLGMSFGIILFFIYYCLFRKYPNLPLTGYARKIFGNYLGSIIGLLYIMYFLYISSRNLRDFGELLHTSTLRETPLLAIIILFVLIICYLLIQGIEVLGRTAEVMIVILILFGAAGNFFVLISGNIDLNNLRPFLENGWNPVLSTAFWVIAPFPFGEMIVFTMLLPYLNQPGSVKKVWLSALISSGLILCSTATLNIAALGVDVLETATFPTLTTIGKVNLFEFLQRLDAIVVFTMLITVFFKAIIFFYGALIGMADLFKLKNHKQLILPIGWMIIFWSLNIASSFPGHLEEGFRVFRPIHIYLVIVIPLLMLIGTMLRNGFKKKAKDKKID
jgi:spore germination protein KB